MTLDCNVSVKDWTPVTIDADFNHTTLWVSKTKASVTSTTTDSIDYESNVMLTEADFGCDEKVTTSSGEKDVIVLSKLDAVKNHRITFKSTRTLSSPTIMESTRVRQRFGLKLVTLRSISM